MSGTYKARAERAEADLVRWRSAFQSVTPQGSEFQSPEAVRDWAQRLKSDLHKAKKNFHKLKSSSCAWVVGNGKGDKWRRWECERCVWTDDVNKATRYARREDAEAVHAGDEDVWSVKEISFSALDTPENFQMTDAQIKHMVERFLRWKLPEHFNPDGGISFQTTPYEPTGTNLFDAVQAEAMVRFMLEDLTPLLSLDAQEDDVEACLSCQITFKPDDMVLMDESGDHIHTACCGPEREGYTLEGEPLKDGDPIPTGFRWGDHHPASLTRGEK